ncbi:MAG: hypothetical protein JSU01_10125 [Bacteroidetes bacterium]|nr:hypothetical protein [Bacteroidota bacterium]
MKIRSLITVCFLTGLFTAPRSASAQEDCSWFPAPCPHESEITNAQSFTERQADNKITPQELAMESNLRNFFTDVLQKLAKQKHWQLYELNESYYDRPNSLIGYAQWETVPYEKRPPHGYQISFILVVNRDSLKAWKDWFTNDLTQQSNQAVTAMNTDRNNEANNKLLQTYMDSAQYYGQLSGKYMQDHQAQYMSDIQSNNKKGIKEHDDKVAWYQKKSDAFIKKYQDVQNGVYAVSTNSFNDLKSNKIKSTVAFANSAIVLVHFSANSTQEGFGVTDGDQKCILPQKPLTVPGAFYAGMLHNPQPPQDHAYDVGEADFLFSSPTHITTVLFGGWLHKYDSYNYARAAFAANPANLNLTRVKTTKCDVVQNLAMHVEGRPDHIQTVIQEINMAALQKLIMTSAN